MLHVALREVVNPRMQLRDMHSGAGASSPDFGIDAARLRRRLRQRHGELN